MKLLKSKNSSGASTVSPGEEEAVQVLSDFVLMDRFHWTPRDIETLTEFEYESILAVIDTLAGIERSNREKAERERKSGNSRRG